MAGRVESYIHYDSITKNKGGCLICVICETDFAAKTPNFIAFCQEAAKLAYATDAMYWENVIAEFPQAEVHRKEVEAALKEKIEVARIGILKLHQGGQS